MKKNPNILTKNNGWSICRHFEATLSQLAVLLIFLVLPDTAASSDSVKRYVQSAGFRYSGYVDARVIEPNTAQYIIGVKFKSGYSKPVEFIMRPYNGKANIETYQPLYEANNGVDKRSFNITHKYYIALRIRENSEQQFTAQLKLFKRRQDISLDLNKPYRFKSSDFKAISEQTIVGEFNQVNEYLFINRVDLKFYLKLNFDILFTEQEIIERFKRDR